MKTKFEFMTNNWKLAKNSCRTTVGKEFTENEPSESFKKRLLISEHSPIRLLEFYWSWKNIKYWVAMEWARHKNEKFISSQRNDRQDKFDRNEARQDSLVNFDGYANMQNLIDAWRKRLCYCATKEARELAEDFKKELMKTNFEEAGVLVPNCIYRSGCPEFEPCGFYESFLNFCKDENLKINSIQERYRAYNLFFMVITRNKK